jgi:hypothetical protein
VGEESNANAVAMFLLDFPVFAVPRSANHRAIG